MPRSTRAVLAGLVLAAALLAGLRPGPRPPDVVLVVLDTLRADHASLCGYARPTTPFLERLAARPDARSTCLAYAPGSWTLPTHASLFTGLPPSRHGAHAILSGIRDLSGVKVRARGLSRRVGPTLAERLAARGLRTLAFSANPVINDKLGLTRGFALHESASGWGRMHGDRFLPALGDWLDRLPRDGRPVFLFLNIADAHQPWSRVRGPETPWPDDRPRAFLHYDKRKADDPWRRYVVGRMSPAEEAELRARVRDLYDAAVLRADRNLEGALALLAEHGICDGPCRLVVTSDHGEMLGEHGLLDHGHHVWEGNQRVPVLLVDTTASGPPPDLPEPFDLLDLFPWMLDGRLPAEPTPPVAEAWPHARRCARTGGRAFCGTWVATWRPDGTKLLWRDGEAWRVDLRRDPEEAHPEPLPPGDPARARLEDRARRVVEDSRDDGKVDEGVLEVLRAFGYVE